MSKDSASAARVSNSQSGRGLRGGRQRGGARLKAIIWTAILFAFIYVCVKVVPVLIDGYQFEDAIRTTARFASVNRQTPNDIRAAVFREAQKGSIPVRMEDIRVISNGGNVQISAQYSVTLDLHVYQWTLNFNPTATNNAL